MGEGPTDPGASPSGQQPTKGQEAIDRRAWPRDKQRRVAGLLALVVGGVLAAVWVGGRLYGRHEAPAAEAPSPPGTFRATPQQLKSLTVESVAVHAFVSEELTEGKIAVNGDRATPVFSPYSGRVTRVIAGLGDTVKAGAPLAAVEASEFVQAQGDLSSAAAQAKLARVAETRKHALYDAKGGSLQDWQQAQADLTAAETALNSVRNRLKILGKSDSDIAGLEASHTMNPTAAIVAPIGGVVVDRQVGPGQYLQAGGGTPVFTIADPASVWLLANVRESDAALVRLGQAVEVHVLAYPKRAFKARVTYVAAVVDPVTHRLPVRAVIENLDAALKPEMFANFRILTSDASDAPAVPESAVVYEGDLAHVWVLSNDGLLAYRSIRTGRNNDGLVEVLDGLKPGERVVTKGGLFIDQAAVPASS
jgi:cobalt-zinc-cadmium efflux system membrane fusion protein